MRRVESALEVRGELFCLAVVAGKAVDARFNKDQAELGVTIAAVLFKVATHGYSFLDKVIEVFGDLRCEAVRF